MHLSLELLLLEQKLMNYMFPLFSTGNAAIVSWILWVTFIWSGVNMDLVSSSVTFLPENVFLLLQSVVVSFIIHMLVQFTGFLDPSCLIQEKWIPLHGLHDSDKCAGVCLLLTMEFFFFLYLQGCQCSYAFICVLMWGNQYLQFLMDV